MIKTRYNLTDRVAFKMIGKRQGGNDGDVLNQYVEELTTKPTNVAFECSTLTGGIS